MGLIKTTYNGVFHDRMTFFLSLCARRSHCQAFHYFTLTSCKLFDEVSIHYPPSLLSIQISYHKPVWYNEKKLSKRLVTSN